jgi:hypothetical protein
MKRLVLALLLTTAACSRAPEREPARSETAEAMDAAEPAPTAPGIVPTAAPGVAFNYRYAFRMPASQIATIQESHAQACEKLGIARCRITGMRYRLIGEDNVEAQLVFKLAPAIARAFGKQGIDAVTAADGTLVDADITGTDAGAEIDRLTVERARAEEERRRLDTELQARRSATERVTLQTQRADAERRIAAADDGAAGEREKLANTR